MALERTVQVGDMVRASDSIGLVEQLSWRAIKVRTMEGNAIFVPNSMASRERFEVFRRGGAPMARVLRIGLEYDAPPARARAELEAAVRDLPGLAAYPPPQAGLHEFADFAVIYELRYWLDDYTRYMEMDGAVRERVWYGLERAGLAIAYPLIRQHQYAGGPLQVATPSRAHARSDRARRALRASLSGRTGAAGQGRAPAALRSGRGHRARRRHDLLHVPHRRGTRRHHGARRGFGEPESRRAGCGGGLRRDQPPDGRAAPGDGARRDRVHTDRDRQGHARAARWWPTPPSSKNSIGSCRSAAARRPTGSAAREATPSVREPESLSHKIARFFGLKGLTG